MICRHVWISGRVQGVGFRHSVLRRVQEHAAGVQGWVKNLPDGSVEALFQGEDEAVLAVLEWCRRGPPSAQVADVRIQEETPDLTLQGFGIR